MQLPVMPPVQPMLAKSVPSVPAPDSVPGGLLFEPKWDGFRCIVFRDGDEVELGSRNERPLTRYFPEVVEAVKRGLPERCVVDGEVIIASGDRLDFEALQLRLHPAESRVRKLAAEIPASFVAFDLLALGDESLMDAPFSRRRALLASAVGGDPSIHLTPITSSHDEALDWFARFEGAGLDGLVCKAAELGYQPDKRVMLKVKHARTADCVVAGFRWHKSGPIVGSLLLGLYDEGKLHHVGVAASFTAAKRAELVSFLEPYLATETDAHPWREWTEGTRSPGQDVSRWNRDKDLSFVLLRPELVVEVGYDHMEGTRFRHTAQFKRWRTDRAPESCTFEQLEVPVQFDLADLLKG